MKQEEKEAIKCMVYAQSFVEALDRFKGSSAFKHQLKNRANAFTREMDKFLDDVYKNGSTDSPLIGLIECCENAIDEVIDNQVEIVE